MGQIKNIKLHIVTDIKMSGDVYNEDDELEYLNELPPPYDHDTEYRRDNTQQQQQQQQQKQQQQQQQQLTSSVTKLMRTLIVVSVLATTIIIACLVPLLFLVVQANTTAKSNTAHIQTMRMRTANAQQGAQQGSSQQGSSQLDDLEAQYKLLSSKYEFNDVRIRQLLKHTEAIHKLQEAWVRMKQSNEIAKLKELRREREQLERQLADAMKASSSSS